MNFYTLCCPVRKKRGKLHKTLLVMKLTFLLLTVICLHLSAATYAQKVTLNEKDASLEKVFNDIKKQTGSIFFYKADALNEASKVTISIKDASLQEALDQCFKDQPLDYTIAGKTVGVKKKELVTTPQQIESAQSPPTVDITGNIKNKAGESMSGATVTIKRTRTGVIADPKGNFVLKGVLPTDILVVSFLGYKTLEVPIGTQTVFNLTLEEATSPLDQVVIQAYGKTSQRYNTGDIGVVRAETIEKQPVMNPLEALEGAVPGLIITPTSGNASGPINVDIRGRQDIGSSISDPLYVIDGIPLSVVDINNGGTRSSGLLQNQDLLGPASGQSPLFSINPDDIESISVLKDAVATSIYGSRGGKGVILITTKKGQAGKTKVEAGVQEGVTLINDNTWPMLNTQQYLSVRREAFKNDGITPTPANAPDLTVWDTNRFTDWAKALYGKAALDRKVETSISGGDARTTFRIASTYRDRDEPTTVSGSDKNFSFSSSLTHKSLDQRFSIGLNVLYTYSTSDIVNLPGTILMTPNAPAIYDANGNPNYLGWAPISNQYPFAGLGQSYVAFTNFLQGRLELKYQIARGLSIASNVGYNESLARQQAAVPISSQNPANNPTGHTQFGYNTNINWSVEPHIDYDATIGKGKFSAVVGGSLQKTTTNSLVVNGSGYTTDQLLSTITDAPNITASDVYELYKFAALFGRINYIWDDKYILDLSGRRDGSSRFGPNNEFGNFGAVGAAWIFTEENWVKNNLGFLSFGKLRTSYGSSGTDLYTPYEYLTRYLAGGDLNLLPYGGATSLAPIQHANPNYKWQVNDKLETAFELGFFKDRLNLEVSYYRDRCGNQLIIGSLPALTGFTSVVENLPALVQNSGEEISVSGKIIDGKDVKWSANFNIAFNQNKLLAFPGLASSPYANSFVIGQSLSLTRVLHYMGVDPLTGQYIFQDKNNDGQISNQYGTTDDRYELNIAPKFAGGFGTEFSYKKLHISAFFVFKDQIGENAIAQGELPGRMANQPIDIIGNEWQKPGDVTNVARFTTRATSSDSYFHNSDAGYTNASFIRLHNLAVSYDLPSSFAHKLGINRCSLFFQGQDLFVITPYKGIDPQVQNFGGLPIPSVLDGGIKLYF